MIECLCIKHIYTVYLGTFDFVCASRRNHHITEIHLSEIIGKSAFKEALYAPFGEDGSSVPKWIHRASAYAESIEKTKSDRLKSHEKAEKLFGKRYSFNPEAAEEVKALRKKRSSLIATGPTLREMDPLRRDSDFIRRKDIEHDESDDDDDDSDSDSDSSSADNHLTSSASSIKKKTKKKGKLKKRKEYDGDDDDDEDE